MKEKIFDLYAKYKKIILISLAVLIVGIIAISIYLVVSSGLIIKEFKNDNYAFIYDSSWKISSKKDKSVVLKHRKGGILKIEIVDLKDEYKFLPITDIIDDLLYDIETQNKDYKFIFKMAEYITRNEYRGYSVLYECEGSQALVEIAKKSDELIFFTYEADNKYFDLLLDSVLNIIYDFDTVEETINLTNDLNIETKKISYNKSDLVVSLLDTTTQQEIAYNNYYVKYSIPSNFKLSSFNSTIGSYKFEGLKLEEGSLSMTVNIYNRNIYEHLDKTNAVNVYREYESYKKNENYSNFTELVDEHESDFESYIYQFSYSNDKAITYNENFESSYTSELNDNKIVIYALDKNHILVFKIKSTKVEIPKELIDMIKIDSYENYSSFINSKNENNNIVSSLKRYVGYENEIEEIIITLPDKYKEIDKNENIYETRNYSLDYNEKLYVYNYDIEYSLTGNYYDISNQIKLNNSSLPKSMGSYKLLTYSGEKTINNKKFIMYDGGYTALSGIALTLTNRVKYYVNVKVLFYELSNGGYLRIEINGNGNQISDQLLNEIVNFEIKNK